MMGMGFEFSFFQTVIPVLSVGIFVLVIGIFVVNLGKGIGQWNKNNHAPVLTVDATVVSKRTNVSVHHDGGEMHHTHSSTSYYVTFQVESGDRMELAMSGSDYGMLVEGDTGRLTFQGTRYQGFERKKS